MLGHLGVVVDALVEVDFAVAVEIVKAGEATAFRVPAPRSAGIYWVQVTAAEHESHSRIVWLGLN